jgi:hypothetical protein
MEYTKSQIRKITEEQKAVIFKALETIDENVAYIRTEEGYHILCKMYVDGALEKLEKALDTISDLIVDTDNYTLGVEIFEKLMPVWQKYCTFANRGVFEIHEAAHKVQGIINYLKKWIKEQEPKSSVNDSLTAFERLAHDCIVFICFKYRTRAEKPKSTTVIVQEMEAYRKTAIVTELIFEIKKHIESCKTPSETEQYICSLLLPFKEFCNVLRPSMPTDESELFIKLLCTGAINHEKENPGTVEHCLRFMLNDMNSYSMCLYGILEKNGLDLNEYQQKTGVYFRREWNPSDGVFFNLGDWDLIKDYQIAPSIPFNTQLSKNKEIPNSTAFTSSSDTLNGLLFNMQTSMFNEGIIEKMEFTEFVKAIYYADFKTMYDTAKTNRNKKRLFLIISRIKTWFPNEWENQAALSMGISVKQMRNITPSEISAAHPKWYKELDKIFPKNNSTQ